MKKSTEKPLVESRLEITKSRLHFGSFEKLNDAVCRLSWSRDILSRSSRAAVVVALECALSYAVQFRRLKALPVRSNPYEIESRAARAAVGWWNGLVNMYLEHNNPNKVNFRYGFKPRQRFAAGSEKARARSRKFLHGFSSSRGG